MSYFHGRMPTIIGAKAFHGPVRDGKEWFHLAIVVRHNCVAGSSRGKSSRRKRPAQSGSKSTCDYVNDRSQVSSHADQAAVHLNSKLDIRKIIGSSLTGN